MQLVKQCIWQQGRHMKDCHGPSLHIVPVVANRSARRTTSIGTWSCVPWEMGGSRLQDEQQVLNIQEQPRTPLKEAAWGGGGRLLGVHQALLDPKEECHPKKHMNTYKRKLFWWLRQELISKTHQTSAAQSVTWIWTARASLVVTWRLFTPAGLLDDWDLVFSE